MLSFKQIGVSFFGYIKGYCRKVRHIYRHRFICSLQAWGRKTYFR